MRPLLRLAKRAAFAVHDRAQQLLLAPRLWWEWRHEAPGPRNERPIEYGYALDRLTRASPETVLDVGCGRSSWPHLLATCGFRTTAVDEMRGYWQRAFFNRHHHVLRDDVTAPRLAGPFDFVTCLSVLEHVPDHVSAFRSMIDLVRPGGHLVVTCPYTEGRYVEDVYRHPEAGYGSDYSFVCRVYSRAQVREWLADERAELVDEQLWRTFTGELWTLGERLFPPERSAKDRPHQLACFSFRRRH